MQRWRSPKVPSYVARQRGTSRRWVGSDGGSGAVGARGELGVGAEGEWEAEGEAGGVPITSPLSRAYPAPENTLRYHFGLLSHASAPVPMVLRHILYTTTL